MNAQRAKGGPKKPAIAEQAANPVINNKPAPPRRWGRPAAKGAVLLAVPVAVLATWLLLAKTGISLLWAIPIYGVIGAVFAVVMLLI